MIESHTATDASAAVTCLGLSSCNLLPDEISAIAQHMHSFSSIVTIDASDNPSLGDTGVELFLRTAITGTSVFFFYRC